MEINIISLNVCVIIIWIIIYKIQFYFRFSDGNHDTSIDSDEIDKFIDTLANTKEMADYYKTEMKQLQKEIESLEDQLETDEQRLLEIPAQVLNEIK